MKILVCMKVIYDGKDNAFPDYDLPLRINRFDEYALEEALVIKDKFPDTAIDVVTFGYSNSVGLLKKALERGADSLTLIESQEELTPVVCAKLVYSHFKDRGYDIIFTGAMAEDFMSSSFGPALAGFFSFPFAVAAVSCELVNDKRLLVRCELEDGIAVTYSIKLPCLVTMQCGGREIRYPTLTGKLNARGKEAFVVKLDQKKDKSLSYEYKRKKAVKGILIEGSLDERCEYLYNELHKRGLL